MSPVVEPRAIHVNQQHGEVPFLDHVEADVYRLRGAPGNSELARALVSSRTFRVVFTLRLCQWTKARNGLAARAAHLLARLLHRTSCQRASVDLSWSTEIGSGLLLVHGWGIVVHPEARIGSNVTILHGATIGRADTIAMDGVRESSSPTIMDKVWLGPGSVVLGDVNVGSGSRVLANSVVTKDVTDSSIVAGAPAQVIHREAPADVYQQAPSHLIVQSFSETGLGKTVNSE